jgi:hypothetical protein
MFGTTKEKHMYMEVYSRRWGHNDRYTVERTQTGWNIFHVVIGGVCDKRGAPYLFMNLHHDSINHPEALGEYMEWLWDKAQQQTMSDDLVQLALDQIGVWIQKTEKASPGGIFSQFK